MVEKRTLYIKVDDKYVPWGIVDHEWGKIPYGLWLVTHTKNSSGYTNMIYKLAGEDDIVDAKILLERIKIEKQILEYMLSISERSISLNEIATELANKLVPMKKELNLRR